MRAVPEAWFSSTVEKDDVKIIKMFYDISAVVSYGHWYDTIIQYHIIMARPDPKSRDRPTLFSLFYVPFTVSTF